MQNINIYEDIFKAVSHQERLNCLQHLSCEEMTVKQIQDTIGIKQSSASSHLSKLYHAGFLIYREEGLHKFYRTSEIGNRLVMFINDLNNKIEETQNI